MITRQSSILFQHKNFRQGAALFAAVQAVAHQEALLHRKADVIQGDLHFPAFLLVNEAADLEGAGLVAGQMLLEESQGEARVDDIFHDQDIPVLGETFPHPW